jgi:GTP-binding nuclear protein Ran
MPRSLRYRNYKNNQRQSKPSSVSEGTLTFKVILAGDERVGKTSLLRKLLTGENLRKYDPTVGVEVHPLSFQTSRGLICLNIWDCAGQFRFAGLRDGYYISGDGFIIMSEGSTSYNWERDILRVCPRVPGIQLVNLKGRSFSSPEGVFECDVFQGTGLQEAFLDLLRRLTQDSNLTLLNA